MFYLGGRVVISMIGAYCEKYISELFRQRIPIEAAASNDSIITAEARRKDYLKIARLSRKYGVRVRVKERKGLYYRAAPFGKRAGLIIGCFFSAVMLLYLRQFVWHIDIHGNDTVTDSFVLKCLEENGITAGIPADTADVLNAERMIMLADNGISWINIEINGSRADVYLSEEKAPGGDEIGINIPCNVIAARDAVIVKADVRTGKLIYKEGSGIAKGAILVSGTVDGGNGSTVLAHADAQIIADFTENVSFSMDYITEERIPGEETFTEEQLMILGFVFPTGSHGNDRSDCYCEEQIRAFNIFGIELPLRLKTDTFRKYDRITVERTTEDIKRILDGRLELYCNNMFSEYEILDTEKEYDITEKGVIMNAKIKLRGDIAVQQIINVKS